MRPKREIATSNGQTYFVTSNSAERRLFFRHEREGTLFLETLYGYRPERYLLHGFVLMPDHFHLIITPSASLELAIQCIKGGFSFRAKKELGWAGEVWVAGFADHRIRDEEDFQIHLAYIANNPVKAGLVACAEQYPYSSANGQFEIDAFPRGLKPQDFVGVPSGAAKAAPFQNGADAKAKGAPVPDSVGGDFPQGLKPEALGGPSGGAAEAAPFQSKDARISKPTHDGFGSR